MKIALLGDTHIGARNDSLIFHEHFRKFYEEVFFPYLDEHGIEKIIQMGDVFDRRKYINFATLHHSREYFFDRVNKDYYMWALVGNHDTYHKNTNDVNSPELLLRDYDSIRPINEPTTLTFDDKDVLLVPWLCDDNKEEIAQAIKDTKADVVLGHFELKGFEMHRGAICEDGMATDIFGDKIVLSGHFHHKSTIGKVTYLGTPYQMTWSDHGDVKGFHILDTDTLELEFVPNPHVMFHKIHYDDTTFESVADIGKLDLSHTKNAYVKVIVRSKENATWFDVFIDKLEKAGAADVQVVEDHFNLNLEDDDEIINEAEDTLTILNKYVDQLNVQGDRKQLDNLIRDLYHEALSLE